MMSQIEQHPVPRNDRQPFDLRWGSESVLTDDPEQLTSSIPVGGVIKRTIDLFIAGLALVFASPVMLAATAAIYVTMGRPIIFAHRRVGFGGKTFRCYKFRTMVNNAEERLAAYLEENPEAMQMWVEQQKLKHDPRVTALGHLLRRSSIDELPQLFNVLAGEMSCIGPRPVTESELTDRYGRHSRYYKRVRPGLTGLWQVSGRTNLSYRKRISLDCLYVRKWSLLLDMQILLKTVPALMRFRDSA